MLGRTPKKGRRRDLRHGMYRLYGNNSLPPFLFFSLTAVRKKRLIGRNPRFLVEVSSCSRSLDVREVNHRIEHLNGRGHLIMYLASYICRCDRILWLGKGIKQLSYKRSELRLSDHRPVSSMFLVEVEVLDHRKLKKALNVNSAAVHPEIFLD